MPASVPIPPRYKTPLAGLQHTSCAVAAACDVSTHNASVACNWCLPARQLTMSFLLQFAWNVEGIEDAEDDFENDLDLDADVDEDADVAADAGAGGGASHAADFDKELAEFENAFD
jgi:hypothetical protein